MSTQNFQFEIVSPEKKLISEPASYVSIPGSEGALGVLPNHAALISTLKAGIVELTPSNDENKKKRIFVAGGFADISAANVTILAEEAVPVEELDRTSLEEQLKLLEEDLSATTETQEQYRLSQEITIAKAKLAAL